MPLQKLYRKRHVANKKAAAEGKRGWQAGNLNRKKSVLMAMNGRWERQTSAQEYGGTFDPWKAGPLPSVGACAHTWAYMLPPPQVATPPKEVRSKPTGVRSSSAPWRSCTRSHRTTESLRASQEMHTDFHKLLHE